MLKKLRILAVVMSCAFANQTGHAQSHPFTVKDDIEMARFNIPSALRSGDEPAFSPDRQYFVVLTSKGNLATDKVESVISLYRTADVATYLSSSTGHPPYRRVLADMSATPTHMQTESYAPIISDLRWSRDSSHIYFLGEDGRREKRLYVVDIHRGAGVPISPPGLDVLRFDVRGDVAIFRASAAKGDASSDEESGQGTESDARAVTDYSIERILFPDERPSPRQSNLWVVKILGKKTNPIKIAHSSQFDISYLPEVFSLSEDAHTLVELRAVTAIPESWAHYQVAKGSPLHPISSGDNALLSPTNLLRLKQYVSVDLSDGTTRALVDAPQSFSLGYTRDSHVAWPADKQRILITNTFLSLDGTDGKDRLVRGEGPCTIADVEANSHHINCVVSNADLSRNMWGSFLPDTLSFEGKATAFSFLTTAANGLKERHAYQLAGGRWQQQVIEGGAVIDKNEMSEHLAEPVVISINQDLNDPPTLWAANRLAGTRKQLWNPNPQFSSIVMGHASVFRWKDPGGYQWTGGLVTPVGYSPGQRCPLVIQIYSFEPGQFLTDGIMPTAFAARALASSGIAVLQIQRRLPHTFTPAEADAQLTGIESAIDQLSEQGLADPNHVGIVGFSFSAWYVENALIKGANRFQAATIADGIDVSYMQYHLWGPTSAPLEREFEAIIGSKPFGDGLKEWMDYAPGFHLNRIQAPLRLEAIGPGSVLGEWEIYSSLHELGRAVDLIYFPEGQHIHQRPCERMASQQGNVDWMRFWLQGYEDPDPAKQTLYRRWREMRTPNAATTASSGS